MFGLGPAPVLRRRPCILTLKCSICISPFDIPFFWPCMHMGLGLASPCQRDRLSRLTRHDQSFARSSLCTLVYFISALEALRCFLQWQV
ncbi:hypothetical protein BDW02DRAFT_351539 [Decorospora gaudefroyi]|uniref:Uncharacterized protein n=1 Tax=Decorospora gaudefroyi TaxID=184978 RepID=A0A6A5K9V2_9PLEO|nr:hypothetical protein BDW02DRAFT_351539 [Decorospora gaudefroyi]